MNKILIILFLSISLTACGSFARKPQVDPVVIETRTGTIPVFHPPLPDPITLQDFKWKVLTPTILEEYLEDLKAGKAPVVVWYAITPKGYEILAGNMAVLKKLIKEQRAIIMYYRENINEFVPKNAEK